MSTNTELLTYSGACRQVLSLNVTAPTMLARHFLALMANRGKGAILFVSSLFGFLPAPYMSVYSATKAYISNLAESLAAEMSTVPGVDVSVLSPGLTNTPMAGPFLANNPGFPLDSPEHTAAVGLRAIGHKAHVVPLVQNNMAVFMMTRLLPGWLVRIAQRRTMASILRDTVTNPNPWAAPKKDAAPAA